MFNLNPRTKGHENGKELKQEETKNKGHKESQKKSQKESEKKGEEKCLQERRGEEYDG
jgi:hypothetical protein